MEVPNQAVVKEFIAAAKAFCDWAEAAPNNSQTEVHRACELLAKLYATALPLPNVSAENVEIPRLNESEAIPIYQRFAKLPVNYYWECFNPLTMPAEDPTGGMINDDLSDIYRDLKYGFHCIEAGHEAEAIWQWKFSFHSHWGRHLVGALRTLHCYLEENYFASQ